MAVKSMAVCELFSSAHGLFHCILMCMLTSVRNSSTATLSCCSLARGAVESLLLQSMSTPKKNQGVNTL